MQAAMPPYCPHCQHIDRVRKLSAIYHAGPRTNLAQRLAPPARPSPQGCITSLFGLILFVLVLLTCGCAVLGWLIGHLTGDTGLSLVTLISGPPLLAILLVSGVALPWSVWERKRVRARLSVWEVQMTAWEQRFYCGRCDDTFIPLQAAEGAYTGQTIRWTT